VAEIDQLFSERRRLSLAQAGNLHIIGLLNKNAGDDE
jgi:hypothetical protein